MGIENDRIRAAIGIAEYHAPNLPKIHDIDAPAMPKNGTSWVALSGVMAAGLSSGDYSGVPSLMEEPEFDDWVGSVGERFMFTESVTCKKYASCLWGHSALMAAQKLVDEKSIRLDDIQRIHIRGFHQMARLDIRELKTEEEAQFSVGWPLAMLLL